MTVKAIRQFLHNEASGGIVLLAASILALAWANSAWAPLYEGFLHLPAGLRLGPHGIEMSLHHWINDALMAVFFLLVGLEIKREILAGELSTPARAALPAIAAVGGMAAPALVYAGLTMGDPENLRGWAIPAATDIAFAVGVLALLGSRVPGSLRVFLLALAIMDDLGAIVIIAAFYTDGVAPTPLGFAIVCGVVLGWFNLIGVKRLTPYMLVGSVLWVCVLKSGVHATLAGVALAFAIPLRGNGAETEETPLHRLEHALHPWVAYGVLPVFAFANAGVPLAGVTLSSLSEPIPLGIALGLFLGKQSGVMLAVWIAVRMRWAPLPLGATWSQLYGVALLTGIGFTMSLFIGALAFDDPDKGIAVRLGVLAGSLASALAGYVVLAMRQPRAIGAREAVRRGEPDGLPPG